MKTRLEEARRRRAQHDHFRLICRNRKGAFVYIVWRAKDRLYKIGLTTQIETRLRALSRECDHRMEVVNLIYTRYPREAERHFHERFAAFRVEGEWFALPLEDVRWLGTVRSWPAMSEWTRVKARPTHRNPRPLSR